MDTPANCCPSLHVSTAFLTAFIFIDSSSEGGVRRERRGYLAIYLVWAFAIAVSTLTTKQHYLVDVVTGFVLALAHYWVFFRLARYDEAKLAPAGGDQAKR
jgi:membrane-associated phospholipid phosphatase